MAAHPSPEEAEIAPAPVEAHLVSMLADSRGKTTATMVVLSSIFVYLSFPAFAPLPLVSWFIVQCVILMWMNWTHRERPESEMRLGPIKASCAIAGLGWGSTLLLDTTAAQMVVTQWCVIAFLFAVTGFRMGTLFGIESTSGWMLAPMWSAAAIGFAVAGAQVLAVVSLAVAAAVVAAVAARGESVTELVWLRNDSKAKAERASLAARTDSLTGLPNRRGILERFSALAVSGNVVALFVDLDWFKAVNDRLGHQAGDLVLIETAERLIQAGGDTSCIGRLGGDEFLVLLPGRTLDDAEAVASRLITAIEVPYMIEADEALISASVGIALATFPEVDPERLLAEADFAMYEAKRSGRRQSITFNASLAANQQEQAELHSALRRALQVGQIEAWGQPVVDIQTGEIVELELLARWTTPSGTSIPPAVFVPMADRLGLAHELSMQMLSHAGRLWYDLQETSLSRTRMCVNVDLGELQDADFVSIVADLVHRYELPPGTLSLDIAGSTDTAPELINARLRQLSHLGINANLDDLGTERTSIVQASRLDVASFKIDNNATHRVSTQTDKQALVSGLFACARHRGRPVIAEGIDQQDDLVWLRNAGVTQAQGNFICRPMPMDELVEAVDSGLISDLDWPGASSPTGAGSSNRERLREIVE